MFWRIILLKHLNQRGDSVLISCDVLSLYLQRSYLFYCKHVTANPCVCSASAERSGSKHRCTGAQTSYALYACKKYKCLYWPSQWFYPVWRPWELKNFVHRNSTYALSLNTMTSNYTIKSDFKGKTCSFIISLPFTKTESSYRQQFNQPFILFPALFCIFHSWPLTWMRVDVLGL